MVTRSWILPAAAVLAFASVGCSSTDESGPVAVSSPAPAGPTAVAIAQAFPVASDSGIAEATVTFDAVEADPSCASKYAKPSQRGHYIAATMDVVTAPTKDDQFGYPVDLDFAVLGPDGIMDTAVQVDGENCIPFDEQFTSSLAAGSHYRGKVLLDAKSTSGSIVYRPHWLTGQSGWSVPVQPAAAVPTPIAPPPERTAVAEVPAAAEPAVTEAPAVASTTAAHAGNYQPYSGTGTPDPRFYHADGSPKTSGEIQMTNGCEDGHIAADVCAKAGLAHP